MLLRYRIVSLEIVLILVPSINLNPRKKSTELLSLVHWSLFVPSLCYYVRGYFCVWIDLPRSLDRTAMGRGISSRRPGGDILCCNVVCIITAMQEAVFGHCWMWIECVRPTCTALRPRWLCRWAFWIHRAVSRARWSRRAADEGSCWPSSYSAAAKKHTVKETTIAFKTRAGKTCLKKVFRFLFFFIVFFVFL